MSDARHVSHTLTPANPNVSAVGDPIAVYATVAAPSKEVWAPAVGGVWTLGGTANGALHANLLAIQFPVDPVWSYQVKLTISGDYDYDYQAFPARQPAHHDINNPSLPTIVGSGVKHPSGNLLTLDLKPANIKDRSLLLKVYSLGATWTFYRCDIIPSQPA